MADTRYPHIYLQGPDRSQGFTSPRRGGSDPTIPERDRVMHSALLAERLGAVWSEIDAKSEVARAERRGAYVDFYGEPGFELAYQSLEDLSKKIRLLAVREEPVGDSSRTVATVYVPNEHRGHFLRRVRQYAEENTTKGKPKNAKLINTLADVHAAVLRSFWRPQERDRIPGDSPVWVELWVSTDDPDIAQRSVDELSHLGITSRAGALIFPERTVRLIHATGRQLAALVEASDLVAEFRLAPAVATEILGKGNGDQSRLVERLLDRTSFGGSDVAVCILDTGVNNGHPLLSPALPDRDLHAVDPRWGSDDHSGHGTLMAGTALWGDLRAALDSDQPLTIRHVLESSKIAPPPPAKNARALWGHVTQQGVFLAEIERPGRRRVACLATTATESRGRGEPTSWSAALDGLASGYQDGGHRLIVVSAGNADPKSWANYCASNLTDEVHDPAQSWNGLTVGAFTVKGIFNDDSFPGFSALAPTDGLSPSSTTSVTWPKRKWPIKPEIMMEGGNVASGPNGSVFDHDDLKLISTFRDPQVAQFASFFETSAAAAQAAHMAARIMDAYPGAWPETVRGLMVHSAEWTDMMKSQFLRDETKTAYAEMMRVCGYGVPDVSRATECAANSLTLVAQSELQPFDHRRNTYVTNEMHLYELPWPTEELAALGETDVQMRVTLSYFVEPSPGEIGWKNRYRYPSHALRFDVNGPNESLEQFVQRINTQERGEEERVATQGAAENWVIGEARNVGSIHSDTWRGTAADLAQSNIVAVYPGVGWWRERHHLGRWADRCRYSLIVSIRTPRQDIDIYTPVAIKVAIPIEIVAG